MCEPCTAKPRRARMRPLLEAVLEELRTPVQNQPKIHGILIVFLGIRWDWDSHADTTLPRWFVVPFVFSSLGCLAEGAEEVMRALAARYAASEAAGGAEAAAGHGILHARWLPRLSAAIERGAWGRLRSLLRDAVGAKEGWGWL